MKEIQNYYDAVELIKTAIFQSQYDATRSVNEQQLTLYYGIDKYISQNSRQGFQGKGAIEAISERPKKSCQDFVVLHPEIYGICAHFLKNGRCWTRQADMIRSAILLPGFWNLQVPRIQKWRLRQFGRYVCLITKSFMSAT